MSIRGETKVDDATIKKLLDSDDTFNDDNNDNNDTITFENKEYSKNKLENYIAGITTNEEVNDVDVFKIGDKNIKILDPNNVVTLGQTQSGGGKYAPFFLKSFKSSKKNKKTKCRKGPRKLNTRRRK
jgi:hypothetical protein